MRKLNRILLLFLALILISLVGIWEFLQTEAFGNSISKNLNRITKTQLGVSVKFENLDFQLFPPGANLNQVSVRVDRDELKASAELGKLGLYFNLLDSFRTKLTIKEFYLEDAILSVEEYQKPNKSSKGNKGFKLNETVRQVQGSLPFNLEKAFLRDVLIKANGVSQFVNMASVSMIENGVSATADLRAIDLSGFTDVKVPVDRVAFKAKVYNQNITIERASVHQGLVSVSASGEVRNYLSKPMFDLKGSFAGEISEAHKFFDLNKIGKLERGAVNGEFALEGRLDSLKATTKVAVSDFITDFAYGDLLEAELLATKNSIKILGASLRAGKQSLTVKTPFELFSLKTKTFTRTPFVITADKLALDNALRYIQGFMKPLQGYLSGDVSIALADRSVRFYSKKNVDIHELNLKTGDKTILGATKASLLSPSFSLVKGEFFMKTGAKINETNFEVDGSAGKKGLEFIVRKGKVSLEELGPFAGLDIKGKGAFDLLAKGKGADVSLEINSNLRDFNFQGYNLDQVKSDVRFNFNSGDILIENATGSLGKAEVKAKARINYKTLEVDSKGVLNSKRYSDVKKILYPILGGLDFMPNDLYGIWNFGFSIGGVATVEGLKVRGAFNGKNNYIYNEGLEKLSFDLAFLNRRLELKNINAKKSSGSINADFSYSLADSSSVYRVEARKLPLSEFSIYAKTPFSFDGNISGKLIGESGPGGKSALLDARLTETDLAGDKYKDSGLSLALSGEELSYDVNILGKTAEMKGHLWLSEQRKGRSSVKVSLDVKDIKKPLGLLKFVDQSTLNLDGALRLNATASFDGLDYETADFSVNLEELLLKKGDIKLDFKNKGAPQVKVSGGIIKEWDVELKGRRIFLVSKGQGTLRGRYEIENRLKVDAGILEVLNGAVSQADGTLRMNANFFRNFFKEDYELALMGEEVSVAAEKLPTAISSANFKVDYRDRKMSLEKFDAKLSSGKLSAYGYVGLKGLIPDLDLKLEFKNAGFPVFKKSNLVVSGKAHLSGNKLPYSLTGDVKVQKLLLVNEVTEFRQGGDTVFKKDYDYLPEQVSNISDNFVNMNIGIETIEPVLLKNSLADVGVIGNAQIIGGESDFRVVGKFSLAPRSNQVYFKGNAYTLTKANIFFYERNKISNPELDIAAYSVINDYRVNIKVYGPVEDFKVGLSSEPALTQEDVLSLIAFGFTEDLSQNLSEEERQSMTQAGVGSIIFDSFKINETLKNEFGLQVNLGTEFQQQNRSYLSRANNDPTLGKVSSATTVELQKQITDAMNLSASSTVGGSIGQKQSMKLNYNFTNKLSVEGVYETRTSDDGDETINDSSLGADVKIRWSFR